MKVTQPCGMTWSKLLHHLGCQPLNLCSESHSFSLSLFLSSLPAQGGKSAETFDLVFGDKAKPNVKP